MIGAAITSVPGSSDYFLGGVICYSNDLKVELCRVPRSLLERHGAVSAEVAEALARGCARWRTVPSGFPSPASPGPGADRSRNRSASCMWVWRMRAAAVTRRRVLPGDRATVRGMATTVALGRLRRFLLETETLRMRTFIAIPLPARVRDMLGDMQRTLKSQGADVRWTAIPSIHLTLKFLGEMDPAMLPRLIAGLQARTQEVAVRSR